MDEELRSEVAELRLTVRAFLENKAPESVVRDIADRGMDRDSGLWRQMAEQLGLQGLMVPEEFGGQGTTFVEMAAVLEETGRALLGGPFLSTSVLGAGALLLSGDTDAMKNHLPGVSEGTTTATVAFSEGFSGREGESTVTASQEGEDWVLSGQVDSVLDGCGADLILVVAPTGEGLGLFAVAGDADGCERAPLTTLDQTRPMGRLQLVRVAAHRVGGDFTVAQRQLLALGATAVAADLAGATGRVLEMAVDYAKVREQFGQPIGAFQAVKHLCVDIFVAAESALSVARYAARVSVESPEHLREAASLAKAYTSEACVAAAEKNIQVHGGIGYSWEHPAHLYLRRVKAAEFLFGGASYHRDELAMVLGLAKDIHGPVTSPDVEGDWRSARGTG